MFKIILAGAITLWSLALWADDYKVTSPDGHLKTTVRLVDGKLSYTVSRDDRTIVNESPLGLKASSIDLTESLTLESVDSTVIDDSYTLPVGKRSQYRDFCHTLSVSVISSKNKWMQTVVFRLYNDGFAFRYIIPKYSGHTSITLTDEASLIRVNNFKSCHACKFIGNVSSNPNYPYEGLYTRYTSWSTLASTGDGRYNSPTLVYNGKDYMLISEADNRSIFCTSLTKVEEEEGAFSYSWTGATKDYAEEKEQRISCTLPAYTPWRMVVCGSIKDVFETTMTENLCPPTTIKDLSWIKPGVASWYWGGSDGNKDEAVKAYGGHKEGELAHADLAVEMGWPYHLIDAGWGSSWFPDFVDHANEGGVECLLWQDANLNSSKDFSNENMDATLKRWQGWGIKGIKVDFWEDDSKETMTRIENLYKAAAKYKMMVNLHGCTRPSGLRRTYPHIMTQEGIYGGEQNFWNSKNNTTFEHLNVLFTRNVVGAMDYTPGDFATWRGSIHTHRSMGHHMALLTLFESSIVHIAESPENLKYFLGRDIMKRLPTAWDESLLLEGNPTTYATVARRKGADWWISGISVNERTCRIKLDFLEEERQYTAYIYRDGTCRSDLQFEKKQVKKNGTLSIKEISEGGFLIQVSPLDNLDVPVERTTYEAEATANTLTGQANRKTYSAVHASGGGYVDYIGNGSKLQFNRIKAERDGQYLLTIYFITCDTRKAKLLVNGEQLGDTITFRDNGDCTSSWNPEGMSWKMIPITLKKGTTNTITIQSYEDMWAPNFDRITIHPILTDEEITGIERKSLTPPLSKGEGAVYDLSGRKVRGQGARGKEQENSSILNDQCSMLNGMKKGIYIKKGKKYYTSSL